MRNMFDPNVLMSGGDYGRNLNLFSTDFTSNNLSAGSYNHSFTDVDFNNITTGNSSSFVYHKTSPYLQCQVLTFIVNGILIFSFCLLGLFGNTISILVLQRDASNKVAVFLLQALAVTDNSILLLCISVLGIIYGVVPYATKSTHLADLTKPYIIKYVHPFTYMTQNCAVWMTVLLAVNRYIAICRPFDVSKYCTIKKARIQVLTVVLFSIGYNIPRFFQYNIVEGVANPTAIGEGSLFGLVYANIIYAIIVLLLPLIILVVLNVKLILELKKMRRRRSSFSTQSENHRGHEENISLIMIIIIIIFVVCNTPDRIVVLLREHGGLKMRPPCHKSAMYYMLHISNFLVVFNSSTNFLIYYFFRSRFRRILLQKLCACSGIKWGWLGSESEQERAANHSSRLVTSTASKKQHAGKHDTVNHIKVNGTASNTNGMNHRLLENSIV